MKTTIPTNHLLDSPVTSLPLQEQTRLMLDWASKRLSKVVCLANSHMIMEAYRDKDFAQILKQADLVSPDGMPLVWMLKLMGVRNQDRVAGMDVFLNLLCLASITKNSVFFLGSKKEVLDSISKRIEQDFPLLSIAGIEPLPFRPLTEAEDEALIERINSSGAGLIFVCLGCPKQEKWMAQHKGKINGVMIGVGAVFEVYAGIKQRAPRFIRESGFEWLYRLIQEPSRLWDRYSKTIPPFIGLGLKQLFWQKQAFSLNWSDDIFIRETSNELLFPKLKPQKIGQILLKQNLITENDLLNALAKQKNCGKKLGEILLEEKFIAREQFNRQLKNQQISLGELLIEKKLISAKQLNEIILEQVYRQQGIKYLPKKVLKK